ncbi:shikimate kinase [Oceanispirochaeta sp.]|jgi:shikimate kinase|uniref:shikimate kinase n=1 Tax=Oceanispirochaeta sp. TaxID=2035350 RepID=UPI002638D020|nr:shikimate kinase [Oceanispirochaeta sp.]MDA3955203.1 hypothetical protein [Oceanispirochaeta sp.]
MAFMPVIALGGIKHTGKSTVGKIVSERLSLPFHDLDDLILKILPPRWTIRKWYKEMGEMEFKAKEKEALRHYLDENSEKIRILALGGGTLENMGALKLLKDSDTEIFILNERTEILYQRIIVKGIPPFLDASDPEGSFEKLYTKRTKTLLNQGDHIIDIHGLNQQQAAEQVIRLIRSNYGG